MEVTVKLQNREVLDRMDRFKTVLFYLLALAGLAVASILFTNRNDRLEFPLPPTFTPTATPRPTATTTSDQAEQSGCVPTPGGSAYGYLPDIPFSVDLAPPEVEGERLVISGAIFASDCVTPLPGALVEVWHSDAQGQYDRTPPYILRGKMRADIAGQYEYATIKPSHYNTGSSTQPAHIHYRVSYPGYDAFGTRLLFQDDPYLSESMATSPLAIPLTEREGANGPVLYGVFDIILPVVPPTPTPGPSPTPERPL